MKDFIKKHIVAFSVLVLLPIVAVGVYFPLWAKGLHGVVDIGSFLGGLLAYVGTVSLGVVSAWQSEKLSSLNNEYQQRLTQTQINHSVFVEASASIVEAISAFDMHKIERLSVDLRAESVEKYLTLIAELRARIKNAEVQLSLRTDYTVEKIDCEHATEAYKEYKKASDEFLDGYDSAFNKIIGLTDGLCAMLHGIRDKSATADTERVKASANELFELSRKYVDELSLSSKLYLSTLQNKLSEMSECGSASCPKTTLGRARGVAKCKVRG